QNLPEFANKRVLANFAIGMFGYQAGPQYHIVDFFAITDPLLARLPAVPAGWRIGHFRRLLPKGYLSTLNSGRLNLQDQPLARVYTKLQIITRQRLFTSQRLAAIVDMNLGLSLRRVNLKYYRCELVLPAGRRFLLPALFPFPRLMANEEGIHAALQHEWEKACLLWREAEQSCTRDYEPTANLGVCYESRGQYTEALQNYKTAGYHYGAPWTGYYESVWLNYFQPEKNAFIKEQEQAPCPARIPVTPGLMDDFAKLLQAGSNAAYQNDLDQALVFFQHARRLDSRRPEAWANSGIVYELLQNYPEAYNAYSLAGKALGRPWLQYQRQVQRQLTRPCADKRGL
ncbi:hypothetical protein JW933_04465, partial [candidate division FCPU426 bacterium]|nr:hypothetical protein [candidate division FCPU426 bacterium]